MHTTNKMITDICLNCGSKNVEKYCPNCGQKAQPTKQPLRVFLTDAVETLFNIDSRWFRTVIDLFRYPGKVTAEYIDGKRASYLPPLRIYISISIVYFLLVQLIDSNQIFFIGFGDDDGSAGNLAKVIQYSLFFLVPVFATYTKLIYRKRKQFFVEHLILSFHIHSIWFVLLMIELLSVWLDGNFDAKWVAIASMIISAPAQFATLLYVVLYLKKLYQEGWLRTIVKSLTLMSLYIFTLAGLMAVYVLIILELFE